MQPLAPIGAAKLADLLAAGIVLAALALGGPYIDHILPYSNAITAAAGFRGSAVPLALVVVLAVVLWRLESRGAARPAHERLLLFGILLWPIGVCATAIQSGRTPLFFWGAVFPYVCALAAFVAAAALRPSPRVVVWAAAWGGLLLAASVILDAETTWHAGLSRRPGGLLINRNYAGEFLALALPACLSSFATSRRRALLFLFGLALALTRCRAAWIGAVVGVGFVVWIQPQARRGLRIGVVWLALGAAAAGVVPNRLAWAEPHPFRSTLGRLVEVDTGSGELRLQQHAATLRLLLRWPLGIGPGSWQIVMRMRNPALAMNKNPHSDYLRAVADGGVPALVGLLMTLAAALLVTWRRRLSNPAALATFATLAFICGVDCPLYRIEVCVLMWFWLGTVLASPADRGPKGAPDAKS